MPEEIRKRNISRNYVWSVNERTDLETILSVKKLIAVRVYSNGEFVSCRYTTGGILFNLDGIPSAEECLIVISSNKWIHTTTGESVCQEENTALCKFDIECVKEGD